MQPIRSHLLFALLLSLSTVLAAPLGVQRPQFDLQKRRLDARQADLTQPVTFPSVTTIETRVGTIVKTCQNTLTPNGDGTVQHDSSCTFDVLGPGEQPPDQPPPPPENPDQPPPPENPDQPPPPDGAQPAPPEGEQPPPDQPPGNIGESGSDLPPEATPSSEGVPPTGTDTLVTSIVGGATEGLPVPTGTDVNQTPTDGGAIVVPTDSGSPSVSPAPGEATEAPSGTETPAAPTGSNLVTTVSTREDGSLTTIITTASPVAQEASVPGRKLEVLPIGLGVFAGISVIALIVVGLVTYERTKYRKAFRQRKLAETGASMGYGGMAETR